MPREVKRVKLELHTDLLRVVEDVHTDRVPRLIEREGEPLAVVIHPDEYFERCGIPKSRLFKKELLSLAGAWSELDADQMIEDLYNARHEAPPSRPIGQ